MLLIQVQLLGSFYKILMVYQYTIPITSYYKIYRTVTIMGLASYVSPRPIPIGTKRVKSPLSINSFIGYGETRRYKCHKHQTPFCPIINQVALWLHITRKSRHKSNSCNSLQCNSIPGWKYLLPPTTASFIKITQRTKHPCSPRTETTIYPGSSVMVSVRIFTGWTSLYMQWS